MGRLLARKGLAPGKRSCLNGRHRGGRNGFEHQRAALAPLPAQNSKPKKCFRGENPPRPDRQPFSGLHSRPRADSLDRLWVKRKPSKHRELSGKCCRGPCSASNFKTGHSCSHIFQAKCENISSGSCLGTTWKWSCLPTICRRQESLSAPNNFSEFLHLFAHELRSEG